VRIVEKGSQSMERGKGKVVKGAESQKRVKKGGKSRVDKLKRREVRGETIHQKRG
jgi:hypothetical protein